ncbi:hypothetical protein PRIPAC_80752 [Pristionchus pacificus]|uniref:Reverse transcriptase domain-containing protein n=1 Tax=Pristionchus pacificus TaxID=54126 RepID=A0A2A6CC18_PRIPA|nr:hypothetical protein PRIPAC_80752 [Pristionchus pacificus]|eukprot:PDM75628.1 hypothetical protein PRIPAC_42805 [Pristionchus pacificus]
MQYVDILDHGKDKTELLQKELLWIRALNTAYPKVAELHRDFVITMVDKASGNYAITCKQLYLQFMEKELNTQSTDGKTYEIKDQADPVNIKINHEKFTRSFGIPPQTEGNLPKIYGIPKMHKNPIKFRFITGAHDSTLKPLSVELQRILRFLHGHFRRYCNNITSHDKINRFFSIQNTFRVVQQLSTIQNKNSKIFCADFSSLFTNLPHDVVKEKIYYLFDLMFKNAGSDYIVVQGTNVKYDRNNSNTSGRSYHKNDLKGIVDFILRNSFAYYGGKLYQQRRGIPQGNNASPQIADLTLAVMEYQYIRNNIRIGHTLSFSLNRTFRYIDDLFHISDKTDEFMRITTDMYHHSLTLEQTNTSPKESAFLDMSVTVTNTGKVQTSLYNKTDDYSFSVVRYPHYESNIPISMGLNTLHGEIIRIFRNCSLFEHFLERTRQVAHYFLQIQYPKEIVYSRLYSTLNRTPAISLKYAVCNNDICMRIIEKL